VPTTTLGYERRFNAPLRLAQANDEAFVKEILAGQPDPPLYFDTMKRVNRDGIAVTGGIPTPFKLTAHEFARSTSHAGVKILDTRRSRKEFNVGHTPNAVWAPLHSSFFSNAAGSFLDAQDEILLMLERPQDVELAARQLYRIGFDRLIGWITVEEARTYKLLTEMIPQISIEDFDATAAQNLGEIIDVRTTAEHRNAHIEGAVSMPYTRIKELIAQLPSAKRLFVHCASGYRAALASSFLKSRGFDVIHVDGDLSNFKGSTIHE
jgi:hydroxyacylglutathione hydrolase